MSASADEVLDAIDGALDDWGVSGDAMRWVPPDERTERLGDDLVDFGREWTEFMNAALARMAQAYSDMLQNIFTAMSGLDPVRIWADETPLFVAGYRPHAAPKPHATDDVEAHAAAWLSRPAGEGVGMLGALAGCSPMLNLATEPMKVRYSAPLPQGRPSARLGVNPSAEVVNEQRRRHAA